MSACLQFLFEDSDLARQVRKMADVVSSDSVTRAFLQLAQKRGSADPTVKRFFLLDRTTRKPVRVHSLSELPIGRLYLYGEGHTLVRCAVDKVLLAGKVPLSIAPMPKLVQRSPDQPRAGIRSGAATPEPAMKRHNAFLSVAMARKIDADDEAARQRRERRAAEARAKRRAAEVRREMGAKSESDSDTASVSDPRTLIVGGETGVPPSPSAPSAPAWGEDLD